jgi:hypothetical protein
VASASHKGFLTRSLADPPETMNLESLKAASQIEKDASIHKLSLRLAESVSTEMLFPAAEAKERISLVASANPAPIVSSPSLPRRAASAIVPRTAAPAYRAASSEFSCIFPASFLISSSYRASLFESVSELSADLCLTEIQVSTHARRIVDIGRRKFSKSCGPCGSYKTGNTRSAVRIAMATHTL